jgi:hypothetical protein
MVGQSDFSNVGAGTTIWSAGVVGGILADLPSHGNPDLINAFVNALTGRGRERKDSPGPGQIKRRGRKSEGEAVAH